MLGLIISIIVIIIVMGGIVWYVFMNSSVAKSMNASQSISSTTMQGGRQMGMGPGMRAGFVSGSIEVLNDNGFTVTLLDGTTKVVDLTATTTLQNYTSATAAPTTITSDQLSVGEQVSVIGAPNADGSVTARTVRTGTPPVRTGGYGSGHRSTTTPQGASPAP